MLSRRHFLRTFSGLGVAGVSTVAYGFSEPELQLRVTRRFRRRNGRPI
jgi:hypothetical protein